METKTKIVALLLLVVYLFTLYGLLKQQIVIFLLFMPRLKKVAGYYVIPFDILSVCPSVCPSVRPSVRQRFIIRVRSITLIPFEIISRNLAQI